MIKEQFPIGELPPGAPKSENLVHNVHRHRQALRPTVPLATNLGFDIDPEYKSDALLLADIYVQKQEVLTDRHAMFASKKQLEIIQKSKTWYLDGTFNPRPQGVLESH